MMSRAKVRCHSAVLAWGVPLAVETAALLRSVVLAWGIGAEDLGRAMVLALTLRLAEMLSDVGIERFLQAAPGRGEAGLLAALHGASLLRGVVVAVLLLVLAYPMAAGLPGGANGGAGVASFAALALVPVLRAGLHLDYRRAEAAGRYVPMAVVEGMSAVIMLAALPAAVTVFGDARAMLALIVVQTLAQVVFSHLVAEAPYSARFDRGVMARLWRFGAPLVLNAALMFLAVQADRFVVAGFYGWAEVAAYGVAFQLASLPAQIAGRAAASSLTAALSGPGSARVLGQAMRQFALLAVGFATGFALLAPPVIGLIWGAALQPSATLALALGLAAGLRILRTPLSVCAIATGRSGDPARANLWRAAALLPALGLAALGLPLEVIALMAALGEAAAAWAGHRLLLSRNPSSCQKGPYQDVL